MPADIILNVTDPTTARNLIAHDPDYVALKSSSGLFNSDIAESQDATSLTPVAIYQPRAWRELSTIDGRCKFIRPGRAICFLGCLQRPDGVWRQVIISGGDTSAYNLMFSADVLVLPLPHFYQAVPRPVGHYLQAFAGEFKLARLHAAVTDQTDSTHLHIDFEVPAASEKISIVTASPMLQPPITGTIDAYLTNDDTLRLTLRDADRLQTQSIHLNSKSISGTIPKFFVDGLGATIR